jgi:hypothetical protein
MNSRSLLLAASILPVTWTATGGTITSDGLYTAGGVPGAYHVVAASGAVADTAAVCIDAASSLVLSDDAESLDPTDTHAVTATVTTTCEAIDATIEVTWSSTATGVATVASTGTQSATVTAVAAGRASIIATAGTRKDTLAVCVRTTYGVDVTPATLSLAPAGTGGLTAAVTDCDAAIADAVTWASRATSVATVASTGDQTATVTGVAAGQVYVVATKSGVSDSALVTVSAASSIPYAPAPPPSLRTVNVSSYTQLVNAMNAALPGDSIHLAPGTYQGSIQLPCGKGGTAAHPIVVVGPRTAIIRGPGRASSGYALRIRGPYWYFKGITVRAAQFTVAAEQCSGSPRPTNLVFDSLAVDSAGQNGYVIRDADGTYLQKGTLKHVGLSQFRWLEGVYVGHSSDAGQMSDSVRVLGMTFGPGIVQEHIDVKGLSADRSTGGLVQGNTFDATGTLFVSDPASNGVVSDQGGSGWRYIANTITNVNSANLSGFFFFTSVNPHASDNSVTLTSGLYGYRVLSPVTNPDLCTNNTGTKNYTC